MMKSLVTLLSLLLMIILSSCVPLSDDNFSNPPNKTILNPTDYAAPIIVSVTASSHDGNVPENVVDNNFSTRWSAQGIGQYITLKFENITFIDTVGIAWYLGDERYSNYSVQTSEDGITWNKLLEKTTDYLSTSHQNESINLSVRYVRITGYGNSQSSWNSITSIIFNNKNSLYNPATSLPSKKEYDLRGDPAFNITQLTPDEQAKYNRLWEELNDSSNYAEILKKADSDDIFLYGRSLHGHLQSVLTVFRLTGDLRLLDYVDLVTQRMKSKLNYGWRGTIDGTDGTDNEFLMWVYSPNSGGGDTGNTGKDRKIDDIKAHALISMVAYALDVNRDLESPTGRNYGANADYWKDYLVNHFEAKWRHRSNKITGHPITTPHSDAHSWWSWVKASYFMGNLRNDNGWLQEANRTADILWTYEIRDVADYDSESFSAYVWMSNIKWQSTSRNYLQSSSYSSSNYGDAVTFYLEGFHNWKDESRMNSFAKSITEFQFTKSDGTKYSNPSDILTNGISQDIGGNVERAGIPPNNEVPRRTASAFATYQTHMLSAWDNSNELSAVSIVVQNINPSEDTTNIASALFVDAYIKNNKG